MKRHLVLIIILIVLGLFIAFSAASDGSLTNRAEPDKQPVRDGPTVTARLLPASEIFTKNKISI